jgi:signal peptidase I
MVTRQRVGRNTVADEGKRMTATDTEGAPRRVRPWLAALLTLVGWGLGLYYAKRTGAAVWLAVISVVAGAAIGLGVIAYAVVTHTVLTDVVNPVRWSIAVYIKWALTGALAVIVWIVAAQQKTVEQGPPTRVIGYFLIWLLPIAASVVLAMLIRFGVAQPYRMPSGSMLPTLHVGDYFAVTKWSYGYSRYSFAPLQDLFPAGRWLARQPQRGDLVVFRPVPEPDRDFVKRLVGLPGDRIQMIDGVLHINGAAVRRESLGLIEIENDGVTEQIQAYRETLPNGVSYATLDRTPDGMLDNTRVFVVPPGSYFMLGDDRDNSADSRVFSMVGYVPYDNLVGRVDFIQSGARH